MVRLFVVFVGACIVKLLGYLLFLWEPVLSNCKAICCFCGSLYCQIVRLFVVFVGAYIVKLLDYLLFLWEPVLSNC
jgi:hypothetical protein